MPHEPSGQSPAGNPENPPPPQPLPSPVKQGILGQDGHNNSNQHPADAKSLAKDIHWIHHATLWSQIGLGLIGLGALYIYHGQLNVMSRQLEQIKSSGGQTDKLISLYQQQLAQLTKQTGDTHDLAVAAGKQADAAKKTAESAKSTAKTAESTLHISERAYISSGAPQIDFTKKAVYVPFMNNGHIPSGQIEVVFYQATYTFTPPTIGSTNPIHLTDRHKRASHFTSIAPGLPLSIFAPFPELSEDKLNSGLQRVMVLGIATYNDGFPNTPKQRWPFCESTVYRIAIKQYFLEPCDPSTEVPRFESMNW